MTGATRTSQGPDSQTSRGDRPEGQGLTDILDQVADLTDRETISIGDLVDTLGDRSFPALMLIFPLISASPASAIPGVTTVVGLIVAALAIQMMMHKTTVWLPGPLLRRQMRPQRLAQGIDWLRKPVGWVERLLRRRLPALVHRPLSLLPMALVLLLALCMPFMELIPMSGTVASTLIALFAAGLLTRDGLLVLISLLLMIAIPGAVWYLGFGRGM